MSRLVNSSVLSSDESEYNYNIETLDKLYRKQLIGFREILHSCDQTNEDIDLCRKWLIVFRKIGPNEKLARNCLLSLMQQHLKDYGYLRMPFRDLRNCCRNLDDVLQDLDIPTINSVRSNLLEQQKWSQKDQKETQVPPPTIEENHSQKHSNNLATNTNYKLACNIEIHTENCRLRQELDALRLQLTESNIELAKVKQLKEKYRMECDKCIQIFENIKLNFTHSIKNTITSLDKSDLSQLKLLQTIFTQFTEDNQFSCTIQKCDEHLTNWINYLIQKEAKKSHKDAIMTAGVDVNKIKEKMRRRYEQRLGIQNWAQKLQLKLVKLKCFSVLRQIYIDSQDNRDENVWNMLKLLEEKYQSIVNEII